MEVQEGRVSLTCEFNANLGQEWAQVTDHWSDHCIPDKAPAVWLRVTVFCVLGLMGSDLLQMYSWCQAQS